MMVEVPKPVKVPTKLDTRVRRDINNISTIKGYQIVPL